MPVETAVTVAVLMAGAVAVAVLTALGSHRRGVGWPASVLCGMFFPVTWTAWYVRDEHPYRR